MSDDLQSYLKNRGAALVAYGDLSEVPTEVRFGLPTGVAIAVALDPAIISGIDQGPTLAYYEEYKRANALLDELSVAAMARLEGEGFRARSYAATDQEIDWKTFETPLPHKTVATRSGLGWVGKCALVITREFGSAVRLTSVLTDAAFPLGEPENASRCGKCRACVDACPAKACTGEDWHLGAERDLFYDAMACFRLCRTRCKAVGIPTVICGICIEACPWTRRYLRRDP